MADTKKDNIGKMYVQLSDGKQFHVENIIERLRDLEKRSIPFPEHDYLPKPPFRMIMVAQSYSGKTNLIANLIDRAYRTYFDNSIIIFSKSICTDPVWETLDDKIIKNCYEQFHESELAIIWREQKKLVEKKGKKKETSLLIVLDDMVSEIFSRGGKPQTLDRLFMRGRHANISLIVTSQKYTLLPLTIRTNASDAIFFQLHNKKEQKAVFDEHGGPCNLKEWLSVTNKAWAIPYNFLWIKYNDANCRERYRSGFSSRKLMDM